MNALVLRAAGPQRASFAACFIVFAACESEPDPEVLEFFEDIEVFKHDSSGRAGVEIYARVFSECAWEHDQAFKIETRGSELRPGVPHEAGRGGLTAVADWRCRYSSMTKRQDLMIECEDQRDRRWVTSFEMVREFRYCFDGESSPLAYAANPKFPPFEDPAPRASYAWETATPRLPLVYDRFGDPEADIIERAYPVDAWDGDWEVVLIDTRPSVYLGRNVVERRMTQRWSPVLPLWTSAVLEITFIPGENPFVGSGDVATFRSTASDWKCFGCERSLARREERPW